MSGVVGVFALGGSRVPCEPRICEMASVITKDSDYALSYNDHRLRLEAVMDPSLEQSSFQCDESGCLTWLLGYFDNKSQLVSRISSEGAEPHNAAELLTRLYQCKGLLAVPMLRGAFIALIWDPVEHRLVLIRDPLGVRNFYFSKDGDHLWFATSPKALALDCATLDMASLHHFMLTGAPSQGRTLTQKIETLKPGELMVAERGQLKRSRYWQFLFEGVHGGLDLDASVSEPAINCQLQLSHSVDGVLARLGKKKLYLQDAEGQASVLSLLMNNQSRHPVFPQGHDFTMSFPALVKLWGQPFGQFSEVYQAMTFAGIEPGQALVLPTGQNILFGLHGRYRDLRWQMRSLSQVDSSRDDSFGAISNGRFATVSPIISHYAVTKRYLSDDFLAEIEREGLQLEGEFVPEWQGWSPIGQMQASLVQWELQPLLSQLARLSLDVGAILEHPFLDLNLVEGLLTLDPNCHLRGVVGGQLLEQAFAAIRQDFSQGGCPSYAKSSYAQTLNPRRSADIRFPGQALGQAQYWDQMLAECADILEQGTGFTLLKQPEVAQLISRCRAAGRHACPSDLRALVFLASLRVWLS